MPENAYRRGHLHQHLTRTRSDRSPELYRALRLYPDWPVCAACRFPIDPAAGTTHPMCTEGVA